MKSANPIRRAVMEKSSGQAHEDIYQNDKKCALALGISRVSANRYKRSGGPLNAFAKYLDHAPDRFRIQAHLASRMIQEELEGLPIPDLITLYHETLQKEPLIEAEDRRLDITPGECWLNRSAASEKDAGINMRKCAIERLFAIYKVTDDDVWGSRR